MQANVIKQWPPSGTSEQTESQLSVSKTDRLLLATGIKTMATSRSGQDEPRLSVLFWVALAALAAVVTLSFVVGRYSGISEGEQKGRSNAVTEQMQKDIDSLKAQKEAEERFKKNLDTAVELDKKDKAKESK